MKTSSLKLLLTVNLEYNTVIRTYSLIILSKRVRTKAENTMYL